MALSIDLGISVDSVNVLPPTLGGEPGAAADGL